MQKLVASSSMELASLDTSLINNSKKKNLSHFFDAYGDMWQIIELEYIDPKVNLITEEMLLKAIGRAQIPHTVRLWCNRTNTVVIGRFQCAKLEVNLDACKKFGIPILTRLTGGGAVYHDQGNLNWTLVLRRTSPLVPKEVPLIYEHFSKSVIHGIRALGLRAEYMPKGTYIHINQKKVAGMAAAIKYGGILLHGTLLVSTNLQILKEVLQVSPRPLQGSSGKTGGKWVRSKKHVVTTLEKELGRKITTSEVKVQLCNSFQRYLQEQK
ncbi:MAG: biotin/lipoate A/B protein ligase family protein [Candidatus Heimdallarchaeota archaeon]